MKKVIYSLFTFLVCCFAAGQSAIAQEKHKEIKFENDDNDDFTINGFHNNPGAWSAVIRENRIQVQFGSVNGSMGRSFAAGELGQLPADGAEGRFTLKREAGTMEFSGKFNGNKGNGTYRFEEDASFRSYLSAQGYDNISKDLMLEVFFTDINRSYLDFLKAAGYKITRNQFGQLAEHNMTRKVMTDYMELFKTENYGQVALEKIVEMRDHGADAVFISNFKKAGYKEISLDKAIELVDHGVSVDFIRDFKVKDISLDQAIELADHGVSPEYINSVKALGYPDLSLEKATELVDHGVSIDYLQGLRETGTGNLTLDKARDLADHGVNPAFLKNIKELGYKNITSDKASELLDHGVSIDFLRQIRQMGFNDLTLDKACELVDHGVSAGFIKEIRAAGFPAITLDKAIELSDHGLSADYIKKMQKKGMKNLSLDEYIKLKDAGI